MAYVLDASPPTDGAWHAGATAPGAQPSRRAPRSARGNVSDVFHVPPPATRGPLRWRGTAPHAAFQPSNRHVRVDQGKNK